jgi:SAM-dependent methyltransferase
MARSADAPHPAQAIDAQLAEAAALIDRGQPDAALAIVDGVLARNPRQVAALFLKGNLLFVRGRYEDAVAAYFAVLALEPEHIGTLLACGRLFTAVGRPDDAWSSFASLLSVRDRVHDGLKPFVLQALRRESLDPQSAERPAADFLCRDPLLQPYLDPGDDSARASDRLAADFAGGCLGPVFEMPLLRAVLEEAIVTHPRLQAFLAQTRAMLLQACADAQPSAAARSAEGFACALALQCFANEYVWPESAPERAALAPLGAKTAQALQAHAPVPALWLAVLGAYQPLHRLPFADALDASTGAHWPLAAVIRRQWLEPREEALLKDRIPALGTFDDAVSNAVRRQYEENPYPRWRRRTREAPQPVDAYLRGLFPGRIPAGFPATPDILVAGCGTGSHPVMVAQRVPQSRILALDLSRASLAYAKRASSALGLDRIEYLQADILTLGRLERSFDVIECMGVLHHLRDPLAGWRVLEGLLRPGGYMHVGLYSRAARRSITAARAFIASRGYSATADGIRAARQAILAGESGLPLQEVAGQDFHSTSSCRDLLFNVQEHLYTPGEIATSLRALNLEFLGFELRPAWLGKLYLQQFPADVTLTSLDNWERFEAAHPAAFFGMYQFWVRKP